MAFKDLLRMESRNRPKQTKPLLLEALKKFFKIDVELLQSAFNESTQRNVELTCRINELEHKLEQCEKELDTAKQDLTDISMLLEEKDDELEDLRASMLEAEEQYSEEEDIW